MRSVIDKLANASIKDWKKSYSQFWGDQTNVLTFNTIGMNTSCQTLYSNDTEHYTGII